MAEWKSFLSKHTGWGNVITALTYQSKGKKNTHLQCQSSYMNEGAPPRKYIDSLPAVLMELWSLVFISNLDFSHRHQPTGLTACSVTPLNTCLTSQIENAQAKLLIFPITPHLPNLFLPQSSTPRLMATPSIHLLGPKTKGSLLTLSMPNWNPICYQILLVLPLKIYPKTDHSLLTSIVSSCSKQLSTLTLNISIASSNRSLGFHLCPCTIYSINSQSDSFKK